MAFTSAHQRQNITVNASRSSACTLPVCVSECCCRCFAVCGGLIRWLVSCCVLLDDAGPSGCGGWRTGLLYEGPFEQQQQQLLAAPRQCGWLAFTRRAACSQANVPLVFGTACRAWLVGWPWLGMDKLGLGLGCCCVRWLARYTSHTGPVWDVEFSKYAASFVSASYDRTACLWQARRATPVQASFVACARAHVHMHARRCRNAKTYARLCVYTAVIIINSSNNHHHHHHQQQQQQQRLAYAYFHWALVWLLLVG